jgi:uncharacterized tellurite resistance protein B-like protein
MEPEQIVLWNGVKLLESQPESQKRFLLQTLMERAFQDGLVERYEKDAILGLARLLKLSKAVYEDVRSQVSSTMRPDYEEPALDVGLYFKEILPRFANVEQGRRMAMLGALADLFHIRVYVIEKLMAIQLQYSTSAVAVFSGKFLLRYMPSELRLQMCEMLMRMILIDGKVELQERKVLLEFVELLKIPSAQYNELRTTVMATMKTDASSGALNLELYLEEVFQLLRQKYSKEESIAMLRVVFEQLRSESEKTELYIL